MATYNEDTRISQIVRWEEDHEYSRDNITLASGENLSLGAVLGKVTATGQYKELDPSASDGTETAAGILLEDCDASSAATTTVALVRDAIIIDDNLVWGSGVTSSQKTTALSQLKGLGIVARSSAG